MQETGENIRGGSVCHRKELISIYVIPSKNISLPKAVKKMWSMFQVNQNDFVGMSLLLILHMFYKLF